MGGAVPAIGSAIVGGASNQMAKGEGPLQAYDDPMGIFGGNSAQAMDPIGYGVFNALGIKNWDPLQVAANKIPGFQSNPNATGINGAASTQFPNLGASSVIPIMPGGSFVPLQNGQGIFNNMASQGAGGMTFNPASSKPTSAGQSPASSQQIFPQGNGIQQMRSLGNFGVPRGYQRQ